MHLVNVNDFIDIFSDLTQRKLEEIEKSRENEKDGRSPNTINLEGNSSNDISQPPQNQCVSIDMKIEDETPDSLKLEGVTGIDDKLADSIGFGSSVTLSNLKERARYFKHAKYN